MLPELVQVSVAWSSQEYFYSLLPLDGMLVHRKSFPRNLLEISADSQSIYRPTLGRYVDWQNYGRFAPSRFAPTRRRFAPTQSRFAPMQLKVVSPQLKVVSPRPKQNKHCWDLIHSESRERFIKLYHTNGNTRGLLLFLRKECLPIWIIITPYLSYPWSQNC